MQTKRQRALGHPQNSEMIRKKDKLSIKKKQHLKAGLNDSKTTSEQR